MFTTILTHTACLDHVNPDDHPESPDRLRAVMAALETEEFAYLPRVEAPRAEIEDLVRVHPRAHVDYLLGQVPASGWWRVDADTAMSPGSGEAALRAAGAVVRAVDMVCAGEARSAFCAVRPPGHHAEPTRAMGFCLFNNVAIGAHRARAVHGLRRVAVVDFDVHHGNGTAALAAEDPDLFFASTHQWPLYPGTGDADETGIANNIVNVPLPAGCDGARFRQDFAAMILPRLEAFAPELILISAGFDAHWRDPLAGLDLTESDLGWATAEIVKIADTCAKGRVVSTLEGGYDLEGLRRSVTHHVRALMGC